MSDRPSVGAAVDLGSNSVHLLVSSIHGHQLRPLADESVFLGLGTTVDEVARLGSAARAALTQELRRYADRARSLDAEHITFLGTEPIRRAGDAAWVVLEVEAATGVPLHVLSHEEEAYLTLLGVTGGLPVAVETLVVDIGGGSSEFCAVAPGGLPRPAGLQLGSGRLTARYATSDPIDASAVAAMRAAADAAVTAYASYYNYHRLHGEIGWQTPAERFDGTPFQDRGFEHVPSLRAVAPLLAELLAA